VHQRKSKRNEQQMNSIEEKGEERSHEKPLGAAGWSEEKSYRGLLRALTLPVGRGR
jgi:hypothetical protein